MIDAKRIDFNQLAKPTNLQNSAVLRMLEEEEARQRGGQAVPEDFVDPKIERIALTTAEVRDWIRPRSRIREYWPPLCPQDGRQCHLLFCPSSGLKRVAWPPPPDDQDIADFIEQGPVQAKTRGIGEYALYQSSSPSGGTILQQPSQFTTPAAPKSWAPVSPLASSPQPIVQQSPTWNPYEHKQEQFSQNFANQGRHSPQTNQFTSAAVPSFEAPPSTITLRKEPPISQVPAPVYQAQPAATKAPTSGSMRGDQKWPPASIKEQTEAENRARIELAKGPVFRPRRVNKDYRGFFAQHALTTTYPGYRAPPGTQYFTPAYQH